MNKDPKYVCLDTKGFPPQPDLNCNIVNLPKFFLKIKSSHYILHAVLTIASVVLRYLCVITSNRAAYLCLPCKREEFIATLFVYTDEQNLISGSF